MHGVFANRLGVGPGVALGVVALGAGIGLWLTLAPTLAAASNFDACMTEATLAGSVTTDGYVSYHCAGTTAEKLAARPDECPVGRIRPALKSVVRQQQPFDDGLLTSVSWTAGRCWGKCAMRSFDYKETSYGCEVRVYTGHDPDPPEPAPPPVSEEPSPQPLHRPPPRSAPPAQEPRSSRPHRDGPRYSAWSPPPRAWGPPPQPRFWSDRFEGPRRPPYWWGPDWNGPPPYSERPRWDGPGGYYCW